MNYGFIMFQQFRLLYLVSLSNLCSTCFLLFDRLPTEMRQEMRDILKEYMPVGDDEEDTRSSSLLPQTNGSTMAQFEVETAIWTQVGTGHKAV